LPPCRHFTPQNDDKLAECRQRIRPATPWPRNRVDRRYHPVIYPGKMTATYHGRICRDETSPTVAYIDLLDKRLYQPKTTSGVTVLRLRSIQD
jgi:hypothetical protein